MREEYGSDSIKLRKHFEQRGYNITESSVNIKNATDYKKPYTYLFRTESVAEKINNKIYISPFFGEVLLENPLKQTIRTYPIDLIYPIHKTFLSQIDIPEGYKVDFMPENYKIENDQFLLIYNTTITDSRVIIAFDYYFKSPLYDATEYKKIKFYFNEIVKKRS